MEVQTLLVSEQQLNNLADVGTISFTTPDGTSIPILDRGAYAIATGETNTLEAASNAFGLTSTATHADLPIGTITLNVAEMLSGGGELLESSQQVRFIAHKLDDSVLAPVFGVAPPQAPAAILPDLTAARVINNPETIESEEMNVHSNEGLHTVEHNLVQNGVQFELPVVDTVESATQGLNLASNEDCDKDLAQGPDQLCQEKVHEIGFQQTEDEKHLGTTDADLESLTKEPNTDTVVIDVSNPIQLCQNSLISVNGQKCVLQQNSETGQLIAYPVKEPDKPPKRRGRPRKSREEMDLDARNHPGVSDGKLECASVEEEDHGRGLFETANEVGAIVKRSARKRKRTKILCDYETDKLKIDGSDDDGQGENNRLAVDKMKKRGRKGHKHKSQTVLSSNVPTVKRARGRPRRYGIKPPDPPPTQSFLIQTSDGQAIMVHIPLSSIPAGVSVQNVAQSIAESLNGTPNEKTRFVLPVASKPFSEAEPVPIPESPDETNVMTDILNPNTDQSVNSPEDHVHLDASDSTMEIVPHPNGIPVSFGDLIGDERHNNEDIVQEEKVMLEDTRQLLPTPAIVNIIDDVVTKAIAAINDNENDTSILEDGCVDDTRASSSVIPLSQDVLSLLMPNKEADTPIKIGLKASEDELEKLQCPRCNFQAFYAKQYQEHLSTHNKDVHKCKCCAYLSLTEDDLTQHYREVHPKCICKICNHMAEHPYVIKRHMCRHGSTGSTCEMCGKTYKDHYILRMHVRMVHMPADVLFECSVCNKNFTRKAHLKRHMRTHDPDKPYKCPLCDYRGCERSDITKHKLIHEEPKHMCEVCGKSFRHVKNKELHEKRHRGQRDYKCGVCDFYGYTFTDIRKHIERKHADSKIIICDKCGQAFRNNQLLNEHRANGQCELFRLEEVLHEPDSSVETSHLDDNQVIASEDVDESDYLVSVDGDSKDIASITLASDSLAALNSLGTLSGPIMVSSELPGASHIMPDGQVTILDGILEDSATNEVTLVADDAQIGTEPLTIVTDSHGNKQVAMVTAAGHVISGVVMDANELSSILEANQQITDLNASET